VNGGEQSLDIGPPVEPVPIDGMPVRPDLALPSPISKGTFGNTQELRGLSDPDVILCVADHAQANRSKGCKSLQAAQWGDQLSPLMISGSM
jgi:hypothetical protein